MTTWATSEPARAERESAARPVPSVQRADEPARPVAMAGLARAGGITARRLTQEQLADRGMAIAALAETAPTEGANMWVARREDATVQLIGTNHGLHLTDVRAWREIITYLRGQRFTHVLSETTGRFDDRGADLGDVAAMIRDLEQRPAWQLQVDDPDTARIPRFRAQQNMDAIDARKQAIATFGLDDAYVALGMNCAGTPERGILETGEDRTRAHAQNVEDGVRTSRPARDPEERRLEDARLGGHGRLVPRVNPNFDPEDARDRAVIGAGDQRVLFEDQAAELAEGLDLASAEQRNDQWIAGTPIGAADNQLWIVGAAHLAGLVVQLRAAGWTVDPHQPA